MRGRQPCLDPGRSSTPLGRPWSDTKVASSADMVFQGPGDPSLSERSRGEVSAPPGKESPEGHGCRRPVSLRSSVALRPWFLKRSRPRPLESQRSGLVLTEGE